MMILARLYFIVIEVVTVVVSVMIVLSDKITRGINSLSGLQMPTRLQVGRTTTLKHI